MANQAYVIGGASPAAMVRGAALRALVGIFERLRGAGERFPERPLRSTSVERPSFALYMDKVRTHETRPFW